MADVLSRFNTANQAYVGSVDSANEFQKSYNQNYYNNILNETNAYDSAVATRDKYISAAKDKAKAKVAEAIVGDQQRASEYIDAFGGALGAYEVLKGVKARMQARAAAKTASKTDADSKGDGDPDESGGGDRAEADTTEGQTQAVENVEDDVSGENWSVTPPVTPRASESNAMDEATEAADEPASTMGSINAGEALSTEAPEQVASTMTQDAGWTMGDRFPVADALQGSNPFGATRAVRAETNPEAAEIGAETTETATETAAAGAAGAGEAAAGEAVAAAGEAAAGEGLGAVASTLALVSGGLGEGAAALVAVAPELIGVAGVGYGMYELFHHHHHKQPPPDLTNAPAPPKPVTINPAAQGATSDLANSRAEFTTPSFDSVTDVAGSISAF